jgi:eukaryotic-like serine/threonine-protein kinase
MAAVPILIVGLQRYVGSLTEASNLLALMRAKADVVPCSMGNTIGVEPPTRSPYLASKPFFRLLAFLFGGGFVLAVLILFVILPLLTSHGSSVTVPEVVNLSYPRANLLLQNQGLHAEVIDSQYFPSLPPKSVISQEPAGLHKAKAGRTVYLVLNKEQPPMTKLPDIIDVNLSQVKYLLENWGLKVGRLKFVPGAEPDLILQASIGAKSIKPGENVQVGTRIDLTISRGIGDRRISMPDLTGLSLGEATAQLNDMGLSRGRVRYGKGAAGQAAGTIIRQSPEAGRRIREGAAVELLVSGKPERPSETARTP